MNIEEVRHAILSREKSRYQQAVDDLTLSREFMDLEPLNEQLHKISLVNYEIIEGIRAKRAQLVNLDWPDYVEAIDPVESAANCAFYEWLDGMNLRYEATRLHSVAGSPADWYVTKKVATLAKLTFGGII